VIKIINHLAAQVLTEIEHKSNNSNISIKSETGTENNTKLE